MKSETSKNKCRPRQHHLDRRAARLFDEGSTGQPDDRRSTAELAGWLGVSNQWLEIGRSRGYGPKFVRIGPRRVRYRRNDVLEWLAERSYQCTSEYPNSAEQLATVHDTATEPEA